MTSAADADLLARTISKLQREHDKLKLLLHGNRSCVARRRYEGEEQQDGTRSVDWKGHNSFLLTATAPDDSLFETLAYIAIFCQMREGGGELDDDEVDRVLTSVERIRTDLDDRCKLVKGLVSFCDNQINNNNSCQSANNNAETADVDSMSTIAVPRHLKISFAKLKKDCQQLLAESRRGAMLFTVLDDVATCCSRNGHVLDQISIISQPSTAASSHAPFPSSTEETKGKLNSSSSIGRSGVSHSTSVQRETEGDSNTTVEQQVVRLGNGLLATVMVEVPLTDLDVETEAQRARELQELVSSMRELGELQQLLSIESHRQGVDLEHSEEKVQHAHALAAAARQHLMKAAKYRVVFLTLAGGLVGAALGGPVGLAVGAKSAAAIAGASAIGGVGTAMAANVASTFNNVEVDEDYERRRLEACH